SIQGVQFNPDGSFASVTGTGTGDADLEIQFSGSANTQTIAVGLGTSGQLDGVTQLGDTATLSAVSQDGYAVGELVSIGVGTDGVITGSYSNGQQKALGQVALAVFSNPEGLLRHGDSMFEVSLNSGAAQILQAGTCRAGLIQGGALESSNVDVAEEF